MTKPNPQPKTKPSIHYWHALMTQKNKYPTEGDNYNCRLLLDSLKQETPNVISLVMERNCNLNCRHCCFQSEKTSQKYSTKNKLDQAIYDLVKQLPTQKDPPHFEKPCLIHTGRTLKDWHLDILKHTKKIRPDLELGLIDNGSYTKLIPYFQKLKLKLNFLDISIDGTKNIHDQQRNNANAWNQAVSGLKHAKKIVKASGRVSSLMTLTKINYQHIQKTADFLFARNYIDELHICPMTPELAKNLPLKINTKEFQIAFEQIKKVWHTYNTKPTQKVFFKIYHYPDLIKLADAVGRKKFWQIFTSPNSIQFDIGSITLNLGGIHVSYFPSSIWPQESFLIDADACNRTAYSHKYTLQQFHDGPGLKKYTISQLKGNEDYHQAYLKQVDHWWKYFGQNFLKQESKTIQKILIN